jgi:hypothetical protein
MLTLQPHMSAIYFCAWSRVDERAPISIVTEPVALSEVCIGELPVDLN